MQEGLSSLFAGCTPSIRPSGRTPSIGQLKVAEQRGVGVGTRARGAPWKWPGQSLGQEAASASPLGLRVVTPGGRPSGSSRKV